MSYIPVSAALLISEFVYASKVCEVLGSVIDFFFHVIFLIYFSVIYIKVIK